MTAVTDPMANSPNSPSYSSTTSEGQNLNISAPAAFSIFNAGGGDPDNENTASAAQAGQVTGSFITIDDNLYGEVGELASPLVGLTLLDPEGNVLSLTEGHACFRFIRVIRVINVFFVCFLALSYVFIY